MILHALKNMYPKVSEKVQILHFLQRKIVQKSPQVVKHLVKDEKWACSTLRVGKDKPICYVVKTRDFARFCGKIKENRMFG